MDRVETERLEPTCEEGSDGRNLIEIMAEAKKRKEEIIIILLLKK